MLSLKDGDFSLVVIEVPVVQGVADEVCLRIDILEGELEGGFDETVTLVMRVHGSSHRGQEDVAN